MNHPPYALKAAAEFVVDQEARAVSSAALLDAKQNAAFWYLMYLREQLDPKTRAILFKAAAAVRILEENPERSFGSAASCLTLLARVTPEQTQERQADLLDYMRALANTEIRRQFSNE